MEIIAGGFNILGTGTCGRLNIYTTVSTVFIPSAYTPTVGDTVHILGNGTCATSVTATQVTGSSVNLTPTPTPITSGSCITGSWSQSNQPPDSCFPYPSSLWQKPLPNAGNGGPMNHLASNSDVIVQTAVTDNGAVSPNGNGPVFSYGYMQVDSNVLGNPFYSWTSLRSNL